MFAGHQHPGPLTNHRSVRIVMASRRRQRNGRSNERDSAATWFQSRLRPDVECAKGGRRNDNSEQRLPSGRAPRRVFEAAHSFRMPLRRRQTERCPGNVQHVRRKSGMPRSRTDHALIAVIGVMCAGSSWCGTQQPIASRLRRCIRTTRRRSSDARPRIEPTFTGRLRREAGTARAHDPFRGTPVPVVVHSRLADGRML